ncbi:hypothetical protein [Streptomyces sp. NBC_00439]|uniref:hypothetical protein n=1 Tax=Streptomyces sp. NBC_00439 TaxID=2903650 RepID=UPI0022591EC2|nr:hypothetical protein [Streptomyces sp. NBC_00439]MCX5098167.1 hypothetical protein [Streptomyces sp. NBC_00439]
MPLVLWSDSVPPVMAMVQPPLAFFGAMTPWIVRARTPAREVRPTRSLDADRGELREGLALVSLPLAGAGRY